VAAVDFLLTYPYAFAVNELFGGQSGPRADWTHWAGQPWVYALIAPVAAVAAWRGVRQVQRLWAGRPAWWRLPAEGAAAAAALPVAVAIFEASAIFRAIGESALLGAGLGLLLTAANAVLARVLRPERGPPASHAPRPAG
jgi:hypothetical protein